MKTKLLLTKLILILFVSTCLFASNTNEVNTKVLPFMLRYTNVEQNHNYNVLQVNSQLSNIVKATAADFIASVNVAFRGTSINMQAPQQTATTQVTISPWKMNNGGGAISFNVGFHGNPAAYSQANIPNASDPNWVAAPVNANGEINYSVNSILSYCLSQLDFTYFETFLNIPANFNISSLNVAFAAADDGARAYIFNSVHPNGAFIGQISLGQNPISADYASLAVAGEINRLVIVQFDDCPSGNNLTGAKVNVNGQVVAINTGGCTQSNFFWSNAPTINGKTASGTINGIGYTYTSSVNVKSTSNVYSHSTFPASFNVPNANPTIQNIEPSSNTLTFASPMTNPVLVFSSIGNGSISVPINFSAPVDVLWSTHVGSGSSFVQNSPTQITGREAYAIVRMNGTFTSISFDYLTYENYVNFAFGADFSTNYPDTIAPTITLNGSASVNINLGTSYTDAGTTVTDNCDLNPASLVSGTVNTNVPGNYTLTFTAVDASGNTSAPLTRTVTVNTPPVANAGADQLFNCASSRGVSVTLNGSGSNDINGDALTYTWSENGTTLATGVAPTINTVPGIHTIKLEVTDSKGATSSDTVVISTNSDTMPPTVVTKPITVSLNASGAASIIPSDIDGGTTDNCSTVTLSLGAGQGNFSCANVGPNTVTLIATDAKGNTASGTAIVTIQDVTPPSILAKDITINLDAQGNATITPQMVDNGSTDACGIASYVLDKTHFTCADIATSPNTVTLTVTDTHGNAASATAKVTVVDNLAPSVITKPISVNLDANGVASISTSLVDNGSSDNCGLMLTLDKTTFSCADLGPNTVLLTGTDPIGNSTSTPATVTVVDNTAPTVITQNITLELDEDGFGSIAPNQIDNGSTDNCSLTLTLDIMDFTVANLGANTVILTGTDQSGNVTTAPAIVTIVDVDAPTILTQDVTIYVDASGNASITPQQIDNGSSDPSGPVTLSLDKSNFSCTEVGTPQTVTLTATDSSGNAASATATVTVIDNIAPTISCPADINVFATSAAGAIVTYVAPVGTDNCSANTALTAGLASGSVFPIGTTVVTHTVTDASGNTASCSFNVTVVGIAPVIVCPADITVNNDLGSCGAIVSFAATETVGIPSSVITYSIAPGSYFAVGTTAVTATATNAIGSSSCTFNVTVNDTEAPTLITQNISTTLTNGVATITANQVNNGSTDNCGIASMSVSPSTFVCGDQGTHIVTLTVTDVHGNVSTGTATVTVLGDVPSISVNAFTAVATQATNTIFLGYGPQSMTLSTQTIGGSGFTYQWSSSTGELVASVANPTVSPKLSTIYTVTVTNSNGCQATSTISVCVIDARAIDKHGKYEGKVLVCHKESSGNDDHDTDHSSRNGSHTIEISVNAVEKHLKNHGDTLGACGATCTSSYVDVVVDNDDDDDDDDHANNDDDDDDDDDENKNGKDDKSKSKASKIKAIIYPNPVIDEVGVGLSEKGEGSIEIYDGKGNRIYQKHSKDLKTGVKFSMKGKKTGTYYARVTCKGKVYTATIFKER